MTVKRKGQRVNVEEGVCRWGSNMERKGYLNKVSGINGRNKGMVLRLVCHRNYQNLIRARG